jgi:mannosylglycerate hydrolase
MTPTYHIVAHTHWDREWYKSFEQFRTMLVHMVDDLLEICASDPDFTCFTLDGQAIVLEDYLAVKPEREQVLRALVQSGRLVIGPWYVLPDEFLVSGESTVRNLLYGIKTCRRFGTPMQVGYIPDSFGHIAMMPAILRGFGMSSALVYRGFGGEPGQTSSEYWWHAPDGTRCMLIHLFRHGYSTAYFHQDKDEEIIPRFRSLKEELDARATTSHRLIMSGGDHHWPDPRLPRTIDLLRRSFSGTFVQSTVQAYADAVAGEAGTLPDIEGELRFGYRYAFAVMGGVYSSRTYIKQANWGAQRLLERYAEPLNAIAVATGAQSQHPLVLHAWKTLLQNHPHDSICGCSIDPVHREMMTRFAAVQDVGKMVVEQSLQHLLPADDLAAGDDRCVFLFNPSPVPRSEVAGAEVSFYLQDIVVGLNPDVKVAPKLPPVRGFALFDEEGQEVPIQRLSRTEGYDITYSNYNYPKQTYAERFSVLVDARRIPPLGFRGWKVQKQSRFAKYESKVKAGRTWIENALLRVEVNPRGEITLTDKTTRNVMRGLHVFEDGGDMGDEYNYSYPARDRTVLSNRSRAKISLLERGPLRAKLRIALVMAVPASAAKDRKARSSRTVRLPVVTTVSLSAFGREVLFETTVDNLAHDHRLRVLFPSGIRTDSVDADGQFAVLRRVRKQYDLRRFSIEHPAKVAPMQRFVAVRDKRRAFVVMTDGLPEYELLPGPKGTLAVTLLRCVGLLAAEDLITRPGGKAGWHNETPDAQCPGQRTFRYAVLSLSAAEYADGRSLQQECERFNLPLMPLRRKNTTPLPMEGSFAALGSSRLVMSALKEAEDGGGIVMRFWNPSHSTVEDLLRFAMSPSRVAASRLDETVGEPLPVLEGHDVRLRVGPSEIVTLRAWFTDTSGPQNSASGKDKP